MVKYRFKLTFRVREIDLFDFQPFLIKININDMKARAVNTSLLSCLINDKTISSTAVLSRCKVNYNETN